MPALLQLAAYADALGRTGVPMSGQVHLVLGDGSTFSHPVAELVPVYRQRRARLQAMLDTHRDGGIPASWQDTRYAACGRCAVCEREVVAARDLLLVAGMRATQRARLLDGGISTIDALASCPAPVPGLSERALTTLRAQAAIQLHQEHIEEPVVEVFAPQVLAALPAPDPGDLFFDFEGDPLWAEDTGTDWGLEYLFGVVEGPASAPRFRPWWAHSRREERRALLDFLDYVTARRRAHPHLHIYHYAAYEKTALLRLAGRYAVGEEIVDELLRAGVLVDLSPIVRAGVRIGQRSYGLKALEPLYAGARDGQVTHGAASIVAYADFCALRDADRLTEAEAVLADIAAYNEADCRSTMGLRDWLLAQATRVGVAGEGAPTVDIDEPDEPGPDLPLGEAALRAFAGDGITHPRSGDQQAAALMAAAVGYHCRERKPFWWGHFDRLSHPVDEWAETRDTLIAATVTLAEDWHTATARQRKKRRHLELIGDLATGSTLRTGDTVFLLYERPVPAGLRDAGPGTRGYHQGVILEMGTRLVDGVVRDVVEVKEVLPGDAEYTALPMALTPGQPIPARALERAIAAAAERMGRTLPQLPRTAAVDILRRIPPRTRSGAPLPGVVDGDYRAALTAAVLDLDHSYLAVQGPPGTGKTYTAARVVADLVLRHRWTVGVVAQSHAVVEHLLDEIITVGVPGNRVLKAKTKRPTRPGPRSRRASSRRCSTPSAGAGVCWVVPPGISPT